LYSTPSAGGPGLDTLGAIPFQVWLLLEGVLITMVWSAISALIACFAADKLCGGMRVSAEQEREGLDITTHGETAYSR